MRRPRLLAQLAPLEVGARAQPGGAQIGRHAQPRQGVLGIGADHHDGHHDRRRWLDALRLERQQHPVETQPEADAGRGLAAQQLDQAVVAPAAAECLLLPLRAPTR